MATWRRCRGVNGSTVRVLVDRTHALHLNQAYLCSRPVTVLGQVHSVPRLQLRAIAIGVPVSDVP